MKQRLENVTLFGLDCVDFGRLVQAAEICQKDFEFRKAQLLTSLPTDRPHAIHIDPIISPRAYSDFMIEQLNDYVHTDFVLVIQHDGFILNPSAWTDEYLRYDYIGAPWWEKGEHIVGNGGFSLRSKKLLDILQNDRYHIDNDDPEDWFICVTKRKELGSKGIRFAPIPLAQRFSLEGSEKDGIVWTDQFGFHGFTWTDISRWVQQHPEYLLDNTLDDWAQTVRQRFAQ